VIASNSTQQDPHYFLKKYFGYSDFREGQLEIIEQILHQRDCLAILPTGGGKSICFQIPGLIFPGICLVISPLISLMKDQVDTLNSKGIKSCYISSLLSKTELNNNYELLKLNKFKFVYIAPERLKSKTFQNIISKLKVDFVVIDEAHCISQWGNTFRPSYKQIIYQTKKYINQCPIVAFTATANQKVQQDICTTLQLTNPFIFYKSFKRTNLQIEVIHCWNRTIKNLALLRLLKKYHNQVGIIYCSTRKSTEELADYLNHFGFVAEYYHGGLENAQKQKVQLMFSSGFSKLIVATNAFGMGIDVSNIRFVVHYQIPGNIENYYQEIGRAGRDRQPSWCYTFYCQSDGKIQYEMLKKYPEKIKEFEQMKKLLITNHCRTRNILNYFGEKSDSCDNCDICLEIKYKSQLQIHASEKELSQIRELLNFRQKYWKISRQFPITDLMIAFLAIVSPKTKSDFLKIPGIGIGFVNNWYNQIKQIFV